MAILDTNLTFLTATAVDAAAGTANVGDVIDLDTIGRDLFGYPTMALEIVVSTTFTSGGAATVSFKLVSDSTGTPATDGAETLHYQSETFGFATLVAGKKLIVPLPGGLPDAERYMGLQVVTAAATTTAGAISAHLLLDAANWKAYADAQN